MRPSSLRWITEVTAAALVWLCGVIHPVRGEPPACLTLHHLKHMSETELAELFAHAEAGSPPVGIGRGRVVHLVDARLPRMRTGMMNVVWRGKVLRDDGSFVNRWAGGIRAIHSHATIAPSWADGRPAIVMEYPPGTPIFANNRDELREVAPGLYLGAFYDRCPCPRLRGYFALQFESCK
jgi:hypothetical protein